MAALFPASRSRVLRSGRSTTSSAALALYLLAACGADSTRTDDDASDANDAGETDSTHDMDAPSPDVGDAVDVPPDADTGHEGDTGRDAADDSDALERDAADATHGDTEADTPADTEVEHDADDDADDDADLDGDHDADLDANLDGDDDGDDASDPGDAHARTWPPPLTPLFPSNPRARLGAFSSIVAGPPHADGSRDLFFGVGLEVGEFPGVVLGGVVRVAGASNEVVWSVPLGGEVYSTPRFVDDAAGSGLLVAGRSGTFARLDPANGSVVWQADRDVYPAVPTAYNFYTPLAVVEPAGGVRLVQVYGGDSSRGAFDPRDPGYLGLVDPTTGAPTRMQAMPDRAESYCSPLLVDVGEPGVPSIVVGSGGETHGGSLWIVALDALADGRFEDEARALATSADKGFIAPPAFVDVDRDGQVDVIVNAMDGRVIAIDPRDARALWTWDPGGSESFSSPALVSLGEGRYGVFVQQQLGVFPNYTGQRHALLDASDGAVIWEQTSDAFYGTSAVAVDLRGEGVDTVFWTETTRFPDTRAEGVVRWYDVMTETEGVSETFPYALQSTPAIVDARGDGRLELAVLGSVGSFFGFAQGPAPPEWVLLRLDLGAPAPERITWGGYLGSLADGHLP